jgi:hypothetical protein
MSRHFLIIILITTQIGLLHAMQPDSVFIINKQPFPKLAIPIMTAATVGAFFPDEPFRSRVTDHPSTFRESFSEISDLTGHSKIILLHPPI